MTQPPQKPGSGGTPGKKGDKVAVRPVSPVRGKNVATNKVTPPPLPDSEGKISVELVPLDELALEETKPASDGGPNDKARLDDPKSHFDVELVDRPLPAKKQPPPSGVDWLNDIEPPPAPVYTTASLMNDTPDWLADVAEIEAALQSAPRPVDGTPLDWLADIQQISPPRAPLPPITPDRASPSPTRLLDTQPPIPLATPVSSPVPTEQKPVGHTNPPPVTEDLLAKQAIAESGYDPSTGQILDQEKYDKWNGRRLAVAAATQPSVTTASVGEVYRNARIAIERWVDDDSRRARIMDSDLEELKKNPEVQAILARFHNYGPVMREKLLHHLEYIVTNRRQYYTACLK